MTRITLLCNVMRIKQSFVWHYIKDDIIYMIQMESHWISQSQWFIHETFWKYLYIKILCLKWPALLSLYFFIEISCDWNKTSWTQQLSLSYNKINLEFKILNWNFIWIHGTPLWSDYLKRLISFYILMDISLYYFAISAYKYIKLLNKTLQFSLIYYQKSFWCSFLLLCTVCQSIPNGACHSMKNNESVLRSYSGSDEMKCWQKVWSLVFHLKVIEWLANNKRNHLANQPNLSTLSNFSIHWTVYRFNSNVHPDKQSKK